MNRGSSSYEAIYSKAMLSTDQASISKSNLTAKTILKDLTDVKKIKKLNTKKNQKIEKLVFFIVQTLRRLTADHLIETTSIWVLINLIEENAEFSRKVMLHAGVPGVLYGILNSHTLAGATREYASQLCTYLCAEEESHEKLKDISMTMSLSQLGVGMGDSLTLAESSVDHPSVDSKQNEFIGMPGFVGNKEGSVSFMESILSSHSNVTRNSAPFVPYVVSEDNAKALSRIFDDGGAVNVSKEQVFLETVAQNLPGPTLDTSERVRLRSPGRASRGGINEFDEMSVDDSMDSASSSFASAFGNNSMFSSRPKLDDVARPAGIRQMKASTMFKLRNQSLRENPNRESAKELHRVMKYQPPPPQEGGSIVADNDDLMAASGSSWADDAVKVSAVHRHTVDDVYGLNTLSSGGKSNQIEKQDGLLMPQVRGKTTGPSYSSPGIGNVNRGSPMSQVLPAATATDFLFELDPLANDESFSKLPAPKLVSEVNDDEESLLSVSVSEMDEEEDEEEEEEEAAEEEKSPKKPSRKLRIRAEKLLDHRFIQNLFSKKMGMKKTQTFLSKLQDMLELIDSEKTGYVTWGVFGRVLVNLAPPHALRADVEEFLDAQVDSDEDQINYREFVISGKVTIIQKQNGRSILPINGWLERQKLYSGDASTWTWKNHLKWYNERKKGAIIWLMRRAVRAQVQETVLQKAKKFLLHQAHQAKAVSFLLLCGHKAANALAKRHDAKKSIMLRCFKARMLRNRKSDAYQFLSVLADKVKLMEQVAASKGKEIKIEDVLGEKPVQRGYEILYETRNKHIRASEGLLASAKRALIHSAHQDEAQAALAKEARRVLTQLILVARAHQWLLERAQFCHTYCCEQDNQLLYLKRKGRFALAYFDRQSAALPWLIKRGRDALEHNCRQEDTFTGLIKTGRFKLNLLNQREYAVEYTRKRRYDAEKLIVDQVEAIKYLRNKVAMFMSNTQSVADQEKWLYDRGQSAMSHCEKQKKALRRLQYQGGRSRVVHRKLVNAYIDLHQIGQQGRISNFNKLWPAMANGQNMDRLNQEIRRVRHKIHEKRKERDENPALAGPDNMVARWEVELKDAFTLLTKNVLVPGESVNDKKNVLDIEREPKISRVVFLRLMKDGALLKMTRDEINKAWGEMDPQCVGFLSFQDVWDWFEHHAYEVHRQVFLKSNGKKYFTFHSSDIVPSHVQALFVFKTRFAVQEWRMVSGEESSEEESSDEDSDDDSDDESDEEGDEEVTELSDWDKAFEKLIDEHKPPQLRTFEEEDPRALNEEDASIEKLRKKGSRKSKKER